MRHLLTLLTVTSLVACGGQPESQRIQNEICGPNECVDAMCQNLIDTYTCAKQNQSELPELEFPSCEQIMKEARSNCSEEEIVTLRELSKISKALVCGSTVKDVHTQTEYANKILLLKEKLSENCLIPL